MKRFGATTVVLFLLSSLPVTLILATDDQVQRDASLTSVDRSHPVRRPAATPNGTYQIAIYDSFEFASGGRVTVEELEVVSFMATYFNWDKVNVDGASVCREIFTLQHEFDPPITLDDLSDGVTIDEDYEGGAKISYTFKLDIVGNQAFVGTVDAVGTGFEPLLDGCNGTFPPLTVSGGKSQ